MIKSKRDYLDYMEADRLATYRKTKKPKLFYQEPEWTYLRLLRKVEYYTNCKKGCLNRIILCYFKYKISKLGLVCGFTMFPNQIGKGVKIFHYGSIIINGSSKLGDYCQIQCGVNIASNVKIGNYVTIYPGVKIIDNITIADNVIIGANSVVTKDILESGITVAGVPAKKISNVGSVAL